MSTPARGLTAATTGSFVWPSRRDWWEAARWVLLVYTFVVALTLAGSFYPYERVVVAGHPWLPRRVCPGCPLCGMTRSLCAMSSGRWAEAFAWNRGGPVLYVCGWLWLLASALFALARAHRRRAGARCPGRAASGSSL